MLDQARRQQEMQPEMASRCATLECQLSQLQDAFDIVSEQHSNVTVELETTKVSSVAIVVT